MNVKKLTAMLLTAVMMMGVLSGCGSRKGKTVSGTVDEIKQFMFVIETEEGAFYSFPLKDDDEIDFSGISVGDEIVVEYEGTISEIDAFTGELISVEKE